MKIYDIITRLEEWQKRLGYNTEQGDLSNIIKDLKEEVKIIFSSDMLKEKQVPTLLNIMNACQHNWCYAHSQNVNDYYICSKCQKQQIGRLS